MFLHAEHDSVLEMEMQQKNELPITWLKECFLDIDVQDV
jgi:hypothetical protein